MGERGTHPQAGGNSPGATPSLSSFSLTLTVMSRRVSPYAPHVPSSFCKYFLPPPLSFLRALFFPLVNLTPISLFLSHYFSSFSRYVTFVLLRCFHQLRFFSLQHVLLYLCAISEVICASAPALFVLYSRCALSEFVLEILFGTFRSPRGKRAINLILFPTPLCTPSLHLSRVGRLHAQ